MDWYAQNKMIQTCHTYLCTCQEPMPPEGNLIAADLAQRAYRMTSRLIESILEDPAFQKVITEP